MKNNTIFLLISAFLLIVLFSHCYKAPVYKMKVTCYYSEDIDTGDVVPDAAIMIGRDDYPNGESAEYAKAEGKTNAQGVFEYEFPYEALLDINAIRIDSTFDSTRMEWVDTIHQGASQIKLVPDEVVEKIVLMRLVVTE